MRNRLNFEVTPDGFQDNTETYDKGDSRRHHERASS